MNQQHGLDFQDRVEQIAAVYERKHQLRIRRVNPPARIMGGGSGRRVIFLANPHLDFVGSWTERNGRGVQIEVKTSAKDRLPILVKTGGLRETQSDAMFDWHRAGGVVFLLWESGGEVRFFTVKQIWNACEAAKAGTGLRHLKFSEGQPVVQGVGMVLHDFRRNMLAHWPE